MNFLDALYAIEPRVAIAILLGVSIGAYTLASNLAWASRRWTLRTDRLGRFALWSSTSRLARVIGHLARWVYFLLLPWGTLMLGWNTTRALGIWRMDWFSTAFAFAALGIGAMLVVIWVWRPYARTLHPHAIDETGWYWAGQIVETLYQETHWAFYRSGPVMWLADFYWGGLFGLSLTLLESWSDPHVRARIDEVTRADAPLWRASLAIISTLVFILTQNSWYCLIVHLLLALAIRRVIGFPHARVDHA
ncbi:MAG: hypothetical protein HY868_22995 [Chloroflexi bacterium]|nr:hypothetical protein [Chloroflexota bacterium]